MWNMTTGGFVSIVAKGGKDVLMVRARDRQSLVEFLKLVTPAGEKLDTKRIKEGGGTDYPFRLVSDEAECSLYAVETIKAIKYSNFKNEAKAVRGKKYADFLGKVWSAGWALTPKDVKDREDARWDAKHGTSLGDLAGGGHAVVNKYDGDYCEICGVKLKFCDCTTAEIDDYYAQKG